MEILTKENFWNDLQGKYPEQMKVFCDWVDSYKNRMNWDELFSDGYDIGSTHGPIKAPKYHDLPIAMQVGIFIQFVMEVKGIYSFLPDCDSMDDWADKIKSWFEEMHRLGIGKYIEPIIEGEKLFSGIRASVDSFEQPNVSEDFDHLEEMAKGMHGE